MNTGITAGECVAGFETALITAENAENAEKGGFLIDYGNPPFFAISAFSAVIKQLKAGMYGKTPRAFRPFPTEETPLIP